MKIKVPSYVNKVIGLLELAGFEAYIVGGCVRDQLLGAEPNDYDVCTNARPEQVIEALSGLHVIETGIKHGTVTAMVEHKPVEITTFRNDGEYEDHRHPKQVTFSKTLKEDLSRRDFTVNAMAYSDRTGLVDMFGGQGDLRNRIIRCVGEPDKRFDEDALRILRAMRFSSVLDFEIEDETAAAVMRNRRLLEKISAERIMQELQKLLCGDRAVDVLLGFSEVMCVIIPELAPCVGFRQNNPHHCYTVYEHLCRSVGNIRKDPALRLTMLLHDIEKPACKTTDENGIDHFKGHPVKSAETADLILRRLKLDNASRERITELIRNHDNRIACKKKTVKKYISKHDMGFFEDYLDVRYADTMAQSNFRIEQKLDELEMFHDIYDEIVAERPVLSVRQLDIDGRDLMAEGYKGRTIGEALSLALDAVIDEVCVNEKKELLSYIEKHIEK